MNGLKVFLTFNLTRCFCLHDWHHEHGLHFCFFFKPLWTRFWNKTPQKGERNAFLSPSSTKGITSVRFAIKEKEPPSRHVGFVYLFPELLRRAGLCGYFFKEVWGKCTWFLDLSNITQILGAPGASLLNFSF